MLETEASGRTPLWRMLVDLYVHPRVETFERYVPEASWGRIGAWLAGLTLLSTTMMTLTAALLVDTETLRAIFTLLPPSLSDLFLSRVTNRREALFFILEADVAGGLIALVQLLIQEGFSTALAHVVAKLFSGDGSFGPLFFLITLTDTPLLVLGGMAQFAPLLFSSGLAMVCMGMGYLLITLLGLYILFLNALAVAAVHHLSLGEGFLAVMAVPLLGSLLGCLLIWLLSGGLFLFGSLGW